MNFVQAYVLTIAVEMLVLWLLLRKGYDWKEIGMNAAIASSATLPFVWFVFPHLIPNFWQQAATSEIFAFAVESGIYFLLFKNLGAARATIASFGCNAASFIVGMAASIYF